MKGAPQGHRVAWETRGPQGWTDPLAALASQARTEHWGSQGPQEAKDHRGHRVWMGPLEIQAKRGSKD